MATIEESIDKTLSRLEAQLESWNAKVHQIVARAGAAGQQATGDSRKQLDKLKAKLDVAQARLDEAKAAGREKWQTLKQDVEQTWQDLEGAFKKLVH